MDLAEEVWTLGSKRRKNIDTIRKTLQKKSDIGGVYAGRADLVLQPFDGQARLGRRTGGVFQKRCMITAHISSILV